MDDHSHARFLLGATVLTALACGCAGELHLDASRGPAAAAPVEPGGAGFDPDVTVDEVPADPSECVDLMTPPSRRPLNRLTGPQYDRTVQQLLGVDATTSEEFLPDSRGGGFPSNADQVVTQIHVRYYADAAEALALQFEPDRVLPCDPTSSGADACVEQFVRDFGAKAFRRPLDDQEVADFVGLYDALDEDDFEASIRVLVSAFLQSPEFLYLPEFGRDTAGAVRALTDWELATRLSYFLWDTMPDERLFELAAAGELSDLATLEAQARRMLADPRAATAVRQFHRHWLMTDGLETSAKDESIVGTFDGPIRVGLAEETLTFADYVVRHGDGTVETLLGADFTFANPTIADFYGIDYAPLDLPGTGELDTDLAPVRLDTSERRGILGHASFHASHATASRTSPILRGAFVWAEVMCEPMSSPPSNVAADPPEAAEAVSVREQYAQHQADPSCAACHTRLDPPGFALERYGPTGQWRDVDDNGVPLDTTVEMRDSTDLDGQYEGPLQLVDALSRSESVSQCVAEQWFRYAFGRDVERADTCNLYELQQRMVDSGGNVRELIVDIVTSRSFRTVRGTP